MLKIKIEKIKSRELSQSGEVEASTLAGLDALISTGQLTVKSPVEYSFRINRVGEIITIQGHVSTLVSLACGRCLEHFDLPLNANFDLVYAEKMPEVEDEFDAEIELSADDLGIVLLTEDEIDMSEPLVEQLLLCLPLKAVCSHDCRGLCPRCGAVLEQSECRCDAPKFDTRFSALKNLKIDSDK